MQWTVQVEARAPDTGQPDSPALTRQQVDTFSTWLARAYGGGASGDGRHWSARVVITESEPFTPVHSAGQAAAYGRKLVLDAAHDLSFPDWPDVRVEVVPGLLGAQEAAAALGVSRQRFHRLRQSGRFPVPVADLGSGPVWLRTAVEGFAARWLRQPGPRPARTVAYQAADGTTYQFTATADERTGTVWVPVHLAVTDPGLEWIRDLGLPGSPRDGTSGPAVFRVPRWEWARRITTSGTPIPAS